MKLRIFEIRWNDGEKEWVAAHTVVETIKEYCAITSIDLFDFDDDDDIVEVPESEWGKMIITNTEYDASDPEDWETMTFSEFMKGRTEPGIVAGTMYF